MKNVLFVLTVFLSVCCNAQLNCKTKPASDGGTLKTCLHKNGKTSTSESWDKDQRFGKMKGFNSNGEEIFSYELRKVGGHASASLEYFPNGQVSKVYFSDAPDGGIQFYNSTTKFDETGKQTEFYETKHPYELEIEWVEQPTVKTEEVPVEPKKEEPKQEIVECAVIYTTIYQIQNLTNSRLRISIKALPNNAVMGTGKEVVLKRFESLIFDTILMANQFVEAKVYQPEVLKIETRSRKNKRIKIVSFESVAEETRRCYWIFSNDDAVRP